MLGAQALQPPTLNLIPQAKGTLGGYPHAGATEGRKREMCESVRC